MKKQLTPHRSTPRRLRRTSPLVVALALPVLALAVVVAMVVHGGRGTAAPPQATATLDPRLEMHAHQVPLTGTLAGKEVHGTLYPGFPGTNAITVTTAIAGGTPGGALEVVATMPGMRMVPVRARLTLHPGGYTGTIALPMFGDYVAHLSVGASGRVRSGTARLSLPIALGG